MADTPEYIDSDGQGWWHPDDGMGIRADPTGSAQYRRVYIFGLAGSADVSLSPSHARRIGRDLIVAAEYASGSEPCSFCLVRKPVGETEDLYPICDECAVPEPADWEPQL